MINFYADCVGRTIRQNLGNTIYAMFRKSLRDHDLEDFRQRVNRTIRELPTMNVPLSLRGLKLQLDKDEMDTMLYYLDRAANKLI